VPDAIWTQIKAIPGVSATKDRITGSDRYAVTAAIALKMRSVAGTDAIPGALIVCSENANAFYDALAASPIAFAEHRPMLGVRATGVPSSVGNVLRGPLAGKQRHVVSSSTYISAGVYASVGATESRLATTTDHYVAATQIANAALAKDWLECTDTGMSSALADSLGGGAFMGNARGILLYTTNGSSIRTTTRTWIDVHSDDITRGWIFGGTGSVPESQRTAFSGLLQ
jgi:hypothetical protein